jgi:hypothetical protein
MSDTTHFHTAQRDVPVPATRQPLFATETLAVEAVIQADPLNTTNILIFDRLVGGVQGLELTPGDSMPVNAQWVMDLPNLADIYIDTITASDKVTITWRD